MRAIFIDGFNQKIEEIDLPVEGPAFIKEVRRLLRSEHWEIFHSNEMITVISDEFSLYKETPSFWVDYLADWPMFGNIICVGRHPLTEEVEDLDEMYSLDKFFAKWCDKSTTEFHRKTLLLQDKAKCN